MKKSYVTFFALVLSTSIIFSTHSTLALDSVAQPTSGTPSTSTTEPATPAAATPADTSTLNLTLEDALKSMEASNSTLKLADSKISIYEKQNDQALARHDAHTPVVDEDSKKDLDLNYKRTQWTLDNAKHDRDTQLKALKVQITNEYESILTLQQQAENTKKQLANLQTIIDQVNLQIKLGLKVPSEIYSYNAQKTKLEAGIKAITNTVNSSMITLKEDVGIDINRNVILTSTPIEYAKFDETDIYGKITKATQDNYDLKRYKEDIEISQIEYDIDFLYDDTQAANQIQLGIEDKKGKIETLPVNQEVQLKTAFNSLKSLGNTIEADKLAVEADQINIDVMQKTIDVGKSSSLDIISLQNTLLNDQYTLQQDINAYMTAAANFQNSLDN